ncbi:response regulator transcription factor [Paenibacillus sp. sgz500958]|uniref:response regulator transcription factor n=1 Tax=Paenibacillus sp. sgz500958 TaxID=3242475 RepID=UPI0036D2AE0B
MGAVVPDSLLGEIQQLQDTFGAVTNQTMVLTNQQGEIITRPSVEGMLYQKILHSLQHLNRPFEPALRKSGVLSHQVVMDNWIPGLKYVIQPLIPEYGQMYFLWSGMYMEEGTKELVLHAFEQKMKGHPDYGLLQAELMAMTEFNRSRVHSIMEKVGVLGSILCKLLTGWALKPETQKSSRLISQLLIHMGKGRLTIEEVLQQMAGTPSAADLYAFAKETEEGYFKVKYASGREAALLLNAVFRQGEGFLGQAVLNSESRHWSDMAQDPRSMFFTQRGMTRPEFITCYPVTISKDKRALLVAIGLTEHEQYQEYEQQEQMAASLLGISEKIELLQRREEMGNEGVLRLKEASKMLPQALSIQELGMQLLDVVMGMPFYPSSVLVLLEDKAQAGNTYFARGWTPNAEVIYVNELRARYYHQTFIYSAVLNESVGNQILLECPLIAENELHGVLSIGFQRRSEADHWLTFTETIASVASSAICLMDKNTQSRKQSEAFLTHVRHYLQNVNSELQCVSLEASYKALDFARFAGLAEEESERVRRASLLAPFKTDFLTECGFYKEELALLRQIDQLSAYNVLMDKPFLSESAQILALVLHHTAKTVDKSKLGGTQQQWVVLDRYTMDLGVITRIDEELLSSFQSFLQSQSRSLPGNHPVSTIRPLNSAALKSPKAEWGISPREEEVLEQIILGKTNKEIANTLFISEHTVKNHISRIFDKMEVTDRSQIIAIIYKRILSSDRQDI